MLDGSADETRRRLEESMGQIARLSPEDLKVEAFGGLRTAVSRASSGRVGVPADLLGPLEPKDAVLRYLVTLYDKKKMYRKQVAAVLDVLLQVDSWAQALRGDAVICATLPEELAVLLDQDHPDVGGEKAATEPPVPEPAGLHFAPPMRAATAAPPAAPAAPDMAAAPDSPLAPPPPALQAQPPMVEAAAATAAAGPAELPVAMVDVRAAIQAAHEKAGFARASAGQEASPQVAAAPEEVALKNLRAGCEGIRLLGYSAANTDAAITAFENFRRGVHQVVQSPSKEDDLLLDSLEAKNKLLQFLVGFYELGGRLKKYRARADGVVTRLLEFERWHDAVLADPSALACFRHLTEERSTPATEAKAQPHSETLRSAAAQSVQNGGIGAFAVRVVAGHNLIGGHSDIYVRAALDCVTKRTEVISDCLNPRWDAAPFTFEVRSADACVHLQVLDDGCTKHDSLGTLYLRVADCPAEAGLPSTRHALVGVPHGELELQATFIPGYPSAGVGSSVTTASEMAEALATAAAAPAAVARAAAAPAAAAPAITGRRQLTGTGSLAAASQSPLASRALPAAALARVPLAPATMAPEAHARELEAPCPGAAPLAVAAAAPTLAAIVGTAPAPEPAPAAPAAPPRSPPAPAPAVVAPLWAVWLTVDPRNGDLAAYPGHVARQLEAAMVAGETDVDLGTSFHGAKVQLEPRLLQRTARGSRDVARVEAIDRNQVVSLHVAKGADWRITAKDAPGADLRKLVVGSDDAVRAGAPTLHAAAPAAALGPAPATPVAAAWAAAVRRRWVTWLSVDPRSGSLVFYPAAVAQLIEAARKAGKDAVDLGDAFYNAKVELRPRFLQRTRTGARDVLRLELDAPLGPAVAHVMQNLSGTWRAAASPAEPGAKEVSLAVPTGWALEIASV